MGGASLPEPGIIKSDVYYAIHQKIYFNKMHKNTLAHKNYIMISCPPKINIYNSVNTWGLIKISLPFKIFVPYMLYCKVHFKKTHKNDKYSF